MLFNCWNIISTLCSTQIWMLFSDSVKFSKTLYSRNYILNLKNCISKIPEKSFLHNAIICKVIIIEWFITYTRKQRFWRQTEATILKTLQLNNFFIQSTILQYSFSSILPFVTKQTSMNISIILSVIHVFSFAHIFLQIVLIIPKRNMNITLYVWYHAYFFSSHRNIYRQDIEGV